MNRSVRANAHVENDKMESQNITIHDLMSMQSHSRSWSQSQSQNQVKLNSQLNSSQFKLTKIRKTQNLYKTPIEKSIESCLIKPQRALRFF